MLQQTESKIDGLSLDHFSWVNLSGPWYIAIYA